MALASIHFSMDERLKKNMEETCEQLGLTMASAFTLFAVNVTRERRLPFGIEDEADPFYGEANMARLRRAVQDAKAGRNMTEHELIDVD